MITPIAQVSSKGILVKPTGLMISGGEEEEGRDKPKKGKRRAWEGLGSEGRTRRGEEMHGRWNCVE